MLLQKNALTDLNIHIKQGLEIVKMARTPIHQLPGH